MTTTDKMLAFFRQHGPMTCTQAIEKGIAYVCDVCSHDAARESIRSLHRRGLLHRTTGKFYRTTFGGKKQTKPAKVFVYSAPEITQ